jgi:hypothetical protein
VFKRAEPCTPDIHNCLTEKRKVSSLIYNSTHITPVIYNKSSDTKHVANISRHLSVALLLFLPLEAKFTTQSTTTNSTRYRMHITVAGIVWLLLSSIYPIFLSFLYLFIYLYVIYLTTLTVTQDIEHQVTG